MTGALDPTLDLSFEREVAVPAEKLWEGWTNPEVLVKWFTPVPWRTTFADIDPRPGGVFHTVMEGPSGERNEGRGCVLEAVPGRRFTWTSAFTPGFRPQPAPEGGFHFTATIELEPRGGATLYRAIVRHSNEQDARTHAEMGFDEGWGMALDQLVALLA